MPFGPEYFSALPRYGVGLGVNPSDMHEDYLGRARIDLDFFEVTSPAVRHQGPVNYREIQRRRTAPAGFRHLRIPELAADHRVLVHSTDLNPVYPQAPEPDGLDSLRSLVAVADAPWVTEDLGVWLMSERHVYPYFMQFPVTDTTLAVTVDNVHRIHQGLGVPFNAEFPPMTMEVGDMHAFDFFRTLVSETGAGMCLDIGHVLSYQIARGASPTADFHRLPWDHITEIHLAGGGIDLHSHGYQYDDSHGDAPVISVCFDMLDEIVKAAPNLRAITLEVFGAKAPRKALASLRTIRERPTVAAWLEGRGEPATPLPQLDEARARTREAVVGMYDLLHGGEKVSGKTLAAAGEPVLQSFAHAEQKRWEYDRIQRLRIHGTNVSSYFPLTAGWLMHREQIEETELFERLVPRLGGSEVTMWDKVNTMFEALVTERPDDRVGPELFRAEQWMNTCAAARSKDETAEFTVRVQRVITGLKTGCLAPNRLLSDEPVTMRHLGECRFEMVGGESDLHDVPTVGTAPHPAEPGRAACCSGQ
ncbi:DUF692 family multinuclear iron-containing protein [Streptomyces sp. NPDC007164]|uniref:multinuclear nonheme iron-dependent oxidase n=1 Tax=Streptomyces sp. NPDC007164 TaxID=3156918 RepID=UPI003406F0FB